MEVHTILDANEALNPDRAGNIVDDSIADIYPTLLKRYQAILVDALVIMLIVVISLMTTSKMVYASRITSIIYIIVCISYIPICSTYAATLGQKLIGIRIRNFRDHNRKINLLQAYARFITKVILGWLSFITIHFNPERRAVHDLVASTVVIKKSNN